jgi:hypothetical protein
MAQADSVPTPIPGPGLPIGTYVATAFFATVVILVGCAPWNFLLILGPLLNKDEGLQARPRLVSPTRAAGGRIRRLP